MENMSDGCDCVHTRTHVAHLIRLTSTLSVLRNSLWYEQFEQVVFLFLCSVKEVPPPPKSKNLSIQNQSNQWDVKTLGPPSTLSLCLSPSLFPSPHAPFFLSPCRGARRSHQEDREGRDPDDDQRQSGGWVQWGGADWGEQEVRGGGNGGGCCDDGVLWWQIARVQIYKKRKTLNFFHQTEIIFLFVLLFNVFRLDWHFSLTRLH